MAEAITIPSPSVFLRASPTPATAAAPKTNALKNARRRSSAEAKKKAARKSSAPVSGADGSVVKAKQSKSRNGIHTPARYLLSPVAIVMLIGSHTGCVTCKLKRLKCDEEKPGCQQCARRKVECGGYKKDFKWRPFEETNVKINIDRQKRGMLRSGFEQLHYCYILSCYMYVELAD